MKIDLKNLTFTIPVKIDSADRKFNFEYITNYLNYNFDTKIIVLEKNESPFHRTKYLNEMAKMATTDFIANYDCDVMFPLKQVEKAYKVLQNNECDFVYPYDGLFVNIDKNVLDDRYQVDHLDPKAYHNFGTQSMGGAVFWNKKAFIDGGMENEYFVSWGCEDWERLKRFQKLGYRVGRIKGPLFHIDHARTHDSNETNPFYHSNLAMFQRLDKMSKDELKEYIKQWPWLL